MWGEYYSDSPTDLKVIDWVEEPGQVRTSSSSSKLYIDHDHNISNYIRLSKLATCSCKQIFCFQAAVGLDGESVDEAGKEEPGRSTF